MVTATAAKKKKRGRQGEGGGRPEKFAIINQEQLRQLIVSGWDDAQVSRFFGITEQTFNNYKIKYPKFFDALKDWKKEADLKVEKALFQRAIGYEYDEVTYEKSNTGGLGIVLSKGEVQAVKHEPTSKTKIVVKQVAPDVTAQIFWLKNRQKEQWRDVQDHHYSGEVVLKTMGSLADQYRKNPLNQQSNRIEKLHV